MKVNCPAIPGTLLESELFGYEKGAFTGAYGSKPGRVELAHRGTLFLDEISELDLALQSKLLQLLQDGQFCRIGAQEDKKVEVRVVCATNRVLEAEIENGTFRQDLVLPHQRREFAYAAVARASRRHPGTGQLLPRILQPQVQLPRGTLSGDLMKVAAEVSLAGQYSRTGEPDQAICDSGQRRSHQQRPGCAAAGVFSIPTSTSMARSR